MTTTPSITGFTEFEIARIFKSLTNMADDFMRIGMAPIARDHCTLAAKVRTAYAAEHAALAEAHGLADWLRRHATHVIRHNARGFRCATCADAEWIVSEAWAEVVEQAGANEDPLDWPRRFGCRSFEEWGKAFDDKFRQSAPSSAGAGHIYPLGGWHDCGVAGCPANAPPAIPMKGSQRP